MTSNPLPLGAQSRLREDGGQTTRGRPVALSLAPMGSPNRPAFPSFLTHCSTPSPKGPSLTAEASQMPANSAPSGLGCLTLS